MTDTHEDDFTRTWWARIRANAHTVGEFKQLVALTTGQRAADLLVFETRGGYTYTLPDHASVPEELYVCARSD